MTNHGMPRGFSMHVNFGCRAIAGVATGASVEPPRTATIATRQGAISGTVAAARKACRVGSAMDNTFIGRVRTACI
jgi:hypothetical protein